MTKADKVFMKVIGSWCLVCLVFLLVGSYMLKPDYKAGDCVQSEKWESVVKIVEVGKYNYRFQIIEKSDLGSEKVILGSRAIEGFDQLHHKITCP